MNTDNRFWNRIAKKYAASPVANQEAYEHKLDKTRELLNADMSVLEIGCGTGTTALKHAPYVKEIVATDFSEKMIEIAIDKAFNESADNISFRCEPAEDLIHHTQQYDVVMAHNLLHLLQDPEKVLKGIYDQLKPNGYLVAGTACIDDMIRLFKYVAPIGAALKLIPYVNCFSELQLMSWIEKAGFTLEYRYQANKKSSVFTILRKAS